MGFITSLRHLREFNTPGCVLAFIKESVSTSVIESVNEETAASAIKEITEGLLYRVNSLRVEKNLSSFLENLFPLPPSFPSSRKAVPTVYLEEEVQHRCLVAEGA